MGLAIIEQSLNNSVQGLPSSTALYVSIKQSWNKLLAECEGYASAKDRAFSKMGGSR